MTKTVETPTCELRHLRINDRYRNGYCLQQKWEIYQPKIGITYEWRDIPMVDKGNG